MIPSHIVIHHSATIDGVVNDWVAIRRYHMSWRYKGNTITREYAQQLLQQGVTGIESPWQDIGYHFGLEKDGADYVWKFGRSVTMDGAHCIEHGMNRIGIGICVVGNYDLGPVPEPMLKMLVQNVKPLMSIWAIPKTNVKRHCDFATYKTCPGTQFQWSQFLEML